MRRSLALLASVVTCSFAAAPARAQTADGPHYVVQVQPAGKLLQTAREFYRKFAAPQLGAEAGEKTRAELEQQLAAVLGKGWRDAIDEERPILLYGRVAAQQADAMPVALLPVKSAQAARQHLRSMGAKLEEAENGVEKCLLPKHSEPVHLRFVGDYVYASPGPGPLARERLVPAAKLIDPGEKSAVVARLSLDRVPRGMKEKLVSAYQEGARGGYEGSAKKLPPGVDEAGRRAVKMTEDWVGACVLDGKEVALRLDIDPATGELKTALKLTPKEGSKLATLLAAVRRGPSLGATLLGGRSLAVAHARVSLPSDLSEFLLTAVRQGVKEGMEKVDNEKAREIISDMARSLEPTVKEGVIDTAVALYGPGRDKRYTAVMAFQLQDAPAVEKAARKLIGFLPADNPLRLIAFDVKEIGGAKVHTYPVAETMPEPVKTLFGKSPALIAFRKDGVLVTYGDSADEYLRRALVAKASLAPPLAVHADADARRVADMAAGSGDRQAGPPEDWKKFADLFEGRLQIVHLTLVGGESLQVRANVNLLLMPRAATGQATKKPAPR